MPKTEIDYSNTIIYKITCKDESCKEVYVGHTTNFVQRKHAHKQSCTNNKNEGYNLKLYKVIRKNGGWDNWNMEIVHFCNCANSYEARKKEQEFFELLNATLNSVQPFQNSNLVTTDKPKSISSSLELLEQHKEQTHPTLQVESTPTTNSVTQNVSLDVCDFKFSSKKFECSYCHYSTSNKSKYARHIMTPKHVKKEKENNENNCKVLNVLSANNNGLLKLVFTDKGEMETLETKKGQPGSASLKCEVCKKVYNSRSGLWKHEKNCHEKLAVEPENATNKTDLLMEILKQNDEFKKIMIKQNEEFKKIMLEQNKQVLEQNQKLIDMGGVSTTNNINNTNNTMNNKFNLNFFLNETCKDAMNIQEFIDFCKVEHADFENFGKYGYVESMTRIIMRNLMELEVHRRPIHCTDAKREVLYVKDNNVWVNDFSREKLIRAIKYIAAKNVKQIPDWMDHNPDSKNTQTKLHDKYMRMVCHSMGGRDEAEDQEYYKKIIRNVSKEVVIDKWK